jgi:hypothetical protein
MYHAGDGSMNFGATYINADYHHVSRYVGRGLPLRLRQVFGADEGRPVPFLDWRNLRSCRPLLRLSLRLRQLRHALNQFRKDSEDVAQRDLAARHPLIDRYRRQPAEELVREIGLGGLHDRYAKLAYQATCFADPMRGNALYYLSVLFPLIVPVWVADFTHTYDRLTAGYRGRILFDRVTVLDRHPFGGWRVQTAQGRQIQATNVVLAAPHHNLSALYPVPGSGDGCPATIVYASGQRRAGYQGKNFVMLRPEKTGLALVWRQHNGRDLIFSLRPQPDLGAIYERSEVAAAVSWKTAVVLSGGDWAPLVLEPGLYLASDYNLCGLEDSFLTGLCAARHILRDSRRGAIS